MIASQVSTVNEFSLPSNSDALYVTDISASIHLILYLSADTCLKLLPSLKWIKIKCSLLLDIIMILFVTRIQLQFKIGQL